MRADLATGLPLPARRHVPGSGSAPERAVLQSAKAMSSRPLGETGWRDCLTYRYGFELADAGFYWEAHEVWEAAWLRAPPASRQRALLRLLIQLVNAQLKLAMHRPKAARRLIDEAIRDFPELAGPSPLLGVDLARIERSLGAWREDVAAARCPSTQDRPWALSRLLSSDVPC